jgi:hypothetical protein
LPIILALERFNSFTTRERDTLAERHPRTEDRLQAPILRRLPQCPSVHLIFGREYL